MSSTQKSAKKILRWTLAIVTIIVIITGLGINYYNTIEYLTLGLLSKNLAFQLHFWFFIPFLLLFILHMFIRPILRKLNDEKTKSRLITIQWSLKENITIILVIILILGVSVYVIGTQFINGATYHLEVTGLVSNPKNYTYNEVIDNFQSYEKVVKLDCVEGWDVTILWQGYL